MSTKKKLTKDREGNEKGGSMIWLYHIIAFSLGFFMDRLFGDPYFLPHPIRLIGSMIGALEKRWNTEDERKARIRGVWLVLVCLLLTLLVSGFILAASYLVNDILGIIVEAVMTYQILSIKCLKDESMKVYDRLAAKDLAGARQAVSMIVGRDVDALDETGVAKAAIETVAENTSDGGIAPMIYTALGGPVLGFLYKTVNTMDSMVGYKNEKYLYFGRCAAKLDDVVNFLPARISAYSMIIACIFAGRSFDTRRAFKIYRRDRRNHASPNSAQTESVCAGALGIQLAGDASYFGQVVHKPYIGDATRPVEYEDIKRANRLLYISTFMQWLIWVVILFYSMLGFLWLVFTFSEPL